MSPTVDTQDIAQMLGVTRPHVTDVLVKKPDFPAPVINRSRRIRRWALEAVEAWANRNQSLEAMSSEEVR
jgi:predicted DNA-binding transcriptional regulator AlpA